MSMLIVVCVWKGDTHVLLPYWAAGRPRVVVCVNLIEFCEKCG